MRATGVVAPKRLKVLLACDSLGLGGLETLLFDIMSYSFAHPELPVVFYLVSTKAPSYYADHLVQSEDRVHLIRRRWKFDPIFLIKLRRLLKREEYVLIHSHGFNIGLHLLLAKIGLGIPMLQTVHGFADSRSPKGKPELFHHYVTLLLSWILSRTIAVSSYLKEELVKMGYPESRIDVINNGIDFNRILEDGKRWSPNWHVRGKLRFGMVGNFNTVRDHATLLKALAHLVLKGEDCELWLAGDGKLKVELEELAESLNIANEVMFKGLVTHIGDFLREIDCFVYSSRSDTFGIGVVEALSFGVPVIVSDNGPFQELAGGGKYAALFRAGDVESLTKQLDKFIRNPMHSREVAREATLYGLRKFGIASHVGELEKIYFELVGRKHP